MPRELIMSDKDQSIRIPKRIAGTLINSLKGGVVPRVGLPYITVGRTREIDALLNDVAMIADGGASFRFIMGRYGSGKSFLLQTIRNFVMDKGFVVADADLSPERRFTGTRGQGLATYRELLSNIATKTKPEGGALTLVMDRFLASVKNEVSDAQGMKPDSSGFTDAVEKKIIGVASELSNLVHGYDFGQVLLCYFRAEITDDPSLREKSLRWIRGEYTTKTEAKRDLGVGVIISDDDWYEYLKVLAAFLKRAGYAGFLILIDELVNIYKIPNTTTRQANYEKLLTMYNDALQGKASYIGTIMCGTPQCIEDNRRGIYSYEALRSRLDSGRFSGEYQDMLSPVIKLSPLTYEEMLVLVEKLTAIHGVLYDYEPTLGEEELTTFIKLEFSRIGADSHITPREVIRDFIEVLDIIYQNPGVTVEGLLNGGDFNYAKNPLESAEISEEFTEFKL